MKIESRWFAVRVVFAVALLSTALASAQNPGVRPSVVEVTGGAENLRARPVAVDATSGAVTSVSPYTGFNADADPQSRGIVERVSPRDPKDPVRVVVELKDQPLIPYLQQLRAEQASAVKSGARISAREQRNELARAIDSQRHVLEQAQAQLMSDLRREGWIKQEHRQFAGLLNAVAITTRYEHLSAIYDDPRVSRVHMDAKVQALLDTSVGVVGAPAVWSMLDGNGNAVSGQGITIAIIDTGIDYRHPDLGGCFGPGCKVIGGFDFVNGDEDPLDDNGHGTYVSGIAAANGVVRGVAPDAQLLAYKVIGANGSGNGSDVIAGIERAVDPDSNPLTDDAADVINISLAAFEVSTGTIATAANRAMAAGSVVVVGAGNNGSSYSTITSPGNAETVVTVGATDNAGQIASFSSRGPVEDKDYVKPEIVAPGVGIRSTAPDGGYATFSGTSLSTPHVAGGAALLKQLHPTLNPQEIKALLVNNARDLGQDVFTQGAGMMDLGAAASAQIVVTPALPSFGLVDTVPTSWQAQLPVTIRNISAQDWSAAVEQSPTVPPGVLIQPATGQAISIAPGQSASFNMQATVDNQALPTSTKPTFHYESSLSLTSGGDAIRVPWVLFKAAILELRIEGVPEVLWVFRDECSDFLLCDPIKFESNCLVLREISASPIRLRVAPGVYNAQVNFARSSQSCTFYEFAMVIKEKLQVNDRISIHISPSDATNSITVGDIIDEMGQPIDHSNLELSHTQVEFVNQRAKVVGWLQAGRFGLSGARGLVPLEIARFSDVSSDIKLNVAAFVDDKRAKSEHRVHYVVEKSFDAGNSSSHLLTLDTSKGGKITFNFADTEALARGVVASATAQQVTSIGFGSDELSSDLQDIHTEPFKITTYTGNSTFRIGEYYPSLKVFNVTGGNYETLVDSGPVAFPTPGGYVKLKGFVRSTPTIRYRSSGTDLPMGQQRGPAFFSSFPTYLIGDEVLSMNDGFNCLGCTGLQKDFRQNLFFEPMGYSASCDGAPVETGTTRGFHQIRFSGKACQTVNVQYAIPTRLFDRRDTSAASITVNTQSTPFIPNVPGARPVIQAPSLDELLVLSDGRISHVLDGDNIQVRLKVSHDGTELAPPKPLSVLLELRLDPNSSWLPLTVSRDDDWWVAALPVVGGAHVGALRIRVADELGNSLVETLNSLFLIGKDATSLAGSAVPTFGELPELTVHATGLLTPFDLPSVTASDSLDGTIAATTDSHGPYPAGRHSIRWTAVNSADVLASAVQILNVVDLTPPQVTPPPDITRPATGMYTAVDLGQASAVDKEEGVLVAVPHPGGPFAVGSHQVFWTAADSSGNRGSATQTVTITGDTSPPPVLTIGDASVAEGDTGAVELVFPVTLSHSTDKPVTFDAVTSDLSADGNRDYLARQVIGNVIAAGSSRTEFRVAVTPDTDAEPSETFRVTLSNVVGAVANNLRAIGTIVNDDVTTDVIQTIAGTGTAAFTGDNGPAVQAAISFPAAIALSRDGEILFADARNHRIRRIAADGTIRTIAGNGSAGFSGDGGPALNAALNFPTGLAIDRLGRVFIADTQNHRVRMILPDGTISTIAGGDNGGFSGDGGPATSALLRSPGGIAVDLSGNLYVADAGNARVRRIDTNGVIATIAGNGSFGSSGDGGPAVDAGLVPGAVAVDASDNVYVTEGDSRRVRRVDSLGVIRPFLGDSQVGGSNGDGGPAASAILKFPVGVAVDAEGNVYVTDAADNRVRKVTTDGFVSTVAGGGPGVGFTGDGGPALNASLLNPRAAAVDTAGNLFIADTNNQRIRRVGNRRLALDARDRFVWFVPPADDALRQGFLRIRNPLEQPLPAQFWGIDEAGVRSPGTVVATLPASGSLQFNSLDLAFGNPAKGLSGRLGEGVGSWTLVTRASETVEPLSYIRTPDGFLTSMHDRVAGDGIDWWVPMFNPASNPNQVSHLRLVNTESDPVSVLIDGIDDAGQPGAETVATTLPSLSALDLSASDLELGNVEKGLAGQLGQGSGKWQLHLSATGRIVAQSQLLDPNGNITNLSTIADDIGQAPGQRTLWFFPAASDVQHQGFVRLINRETRSGEVRVWGIDDAGTISPGAITLTLAANESRQFNSQDTVLGNPLKGLDGSLGIGTGDWRLVIASDLDLQAMAFIRTPDGFLTSMHDVGPVAGTSLQIPIFNPAQNPNQVSWLRLINPNGFAVTAVIDGVDDDGARASGQVSLTLPPRAAIEISATDLEAGNPALGLLGKLGNGEGKWALEVTASAPIKAISLLRDPRGFITNLSHDARTSSRLDP